MLKPALRIAAVLAILLPPSLAPAQSYELLHEGAGPQEARHSLVVTPDMRSKLGGPV